MERCDRISRASETGQMVFEENKPRDGFFIVAEGERFLISFVSSDVINSPADRGLIKFAAILNYI